MEKREDRPPVVTKHRPPRCVHHEPVPGSGVVYMTRYTVIAVVIGVSQGRGDGEGTGSQEQSLLSASDTL